MREIKFRGLSVNGDWHVGYLSIIKRDVPGYPVKTGYYISNKVGSPFAYQVRPETVGQFTGLTDKNGIEIYEGDFIRNSQGFLFVIRWSNDQEYCGFVAQRMDEQNFSELFIAKHFLNSQVDGNIYEPAVCQEMKSSEIP